jgi:hypothetical protein
VPRSSSAWAGLFLGKVATWQVETGSQRPDNMFVLLPSHIPGIILSAIIY